MEKVDIISQIQKIINEWGVFTVHEIDGCSVPTTHHPIEKHLIYLDSFNMKGASWHGGSSSRKSGYIFYEDLTKEILDIIFKIAIIYNEINLNSICDYCLDEDY
jgi:hypothetical protein